MESVFLGSDALACGQLTKHELRRWYRPIFRNVYTPKDLEPSLRIRTTGAWLRTRRRGVVSGVAASALHGASWVDDDQDIVRTGLRMILDAQPDIEVVGEAVDGRDALELAHSLRPDVCLFDIRMPEYDGIEVTRRLAGPDVADPLAVVVITTFDMDEYVHGALKAGARGFLLKDAGPELLAQAVRSAAAGDALIAPSVTARLLSAFSELGASTTEQAAQPIDPLTEREEEVLVTVARGCTNAEIADDLHISLSTVKTHLASLMSKLGARNRVELAMWAYETDRMPTN